MIICIDYGRAKIGLARTEGYLADPWQVVRVNSFEDALKKVQKVLEVEKVQKIVVGISEGEMAKEQELFAKELGRLTGLKIILWDEGLSTQDAQALAIQSGAGPKKRHKMEDAYAATLVLQSFIDDRQEGTRSD